MLGTAFPYGFVAVTLNVYAVFDDKPVTTIGLEEPEAVIDPGFDVIVNVVTKPPPEPGVKVTDAAALLNALDVPTSVAVPIVGIDGITPN